MEGDGSCGQHPGIFSLARDPDTHLPTGDPMLAPAAGLSRGPARMTPLGISCGTLDPTGMLNIILLRLWENKYGEKLLPR